MVGAQPVATLSLYCLCEREIICNQAVRQALSVTMPVIMMQIQVRGDDFVVRLVASQYAHFHSFLLLLGLPFATDIFYMFICALNRRGEVDRSNKVPLVPSL